MMKDCSMELMRAARGQLMTEYGEVENDCQYRSWIFLGFSLRLSWSGKRCQKTRSGIHSVGRSKMVFMT
jgi:hypothetical protein